MEPSLQNISPNNNNSLEFTLNNVNVSIANSLRRIILSHIPVYVMRTSPYEKNDANIIKNTTRFNNEVLKQRLSCIPLHINDSKFPYETFEIEINKKNTSGNIEYITTEDFKVKNILNNEYITKEDKDKIFPPNKYTKNYIDFARLRPAISDEIPGEELKLTCKISKSNAHEDGMFNAVSTCSYSNTVDDSKAQSEWNKLEKSYASEYNDEEIKKLYDNFMLLNAKRYFIPDSFDFIIESIGIYDNYKLVLLGCDELIKKFTFVIKQIDDDTIEINQSPNTNENSFDIILENEDYTIGKVIEYILYTKYYEDNKNKKINYCGFIKKHPHDSYSIIRIIYENDVNDTFVKNDLKICCLTAIEIYNKIKSLFI